MQTGDQSLNEMLLIRREKLSKLIEKGKNPFLIEKFDYTHHSETIKSDFDKLEGKEVAVSGRIMSRRGHGKASFMDIQDNDGRIQIFAKQDNLGEEEYEDLSYLDIGDIIGAIGRVFKTQTGEVSVKEIGRASCRERV